MKGGRTQAASLFVALMLSTYASADLKVKVEIHYSLVGGPPGIANSGGNVDVYYVKGSARRKDEWTASGPRSAVIRHCDSGEGFYVDFDHKQYWEIGGPVRHSTPAPHRSGAKGAAASGQPSGAPAVTVRSRSVETGKPQVILGRVARHFVTTAKESLGDSNGTPHAEETIDGWYWSDIRQVSSDCVRGDLASEPSAWIGEPDPVIGAIPVFDHSGPSPTGLAVEETRTVRSRPSQTHAGWNAVTTIESKVVEFSDSPLDPSLFLVPSGFRKIPKPKGAGLR